MRVTVSMTPLDPTMRAVLKFGVFAPVGVRVTPIAMIRETGRPSAVAMVLRLPRQRRRRPSQGWGWLLEMRAHLLPLRAVARDHRPHVVREPSAGGQHPGRPRPGD